MFLRLPVKTNIVSKQLHDEGRDAAVDADEDVDAGEDDVRRARDGEEEGGGVHERRDWPAAKKTKPRRRKKMNSQNSNSHVWVQGVHFLFAKEYQ